MYVTDFEYANRRLSDFGCIVCHINTEYGFNEVQLGCDITFNTVKNNHSSIHSIASSTYENVYTTTFEIAKNYCNAGVDDIYMTSLEARALIRWLNRREHAKFRMFNDIANESIVCHYGSFNVNQIMAGDKIIGLSLTFTSNAPYGFSDPVQSKHMILQDVDEIYLHGDSDELGVICPRIEVRCFEDGELKIENLLTGTEVIVKNCRMDETIIIDGEYKIIMTNDIDHESTLYNDFNYSYFDILVDEYGTQNKYKVSLPCEITISYSPIRKVGVC